MNKFSKEEQNQEAYYNAIARQYDRHYASANALKYRYWAYDLALKNLDLEGKRVLDAMCGGGEGTGYFLRKGARVTGLDISEECCAVYRMRYPDGEVVCASALETGFPDNTFDLVMTDSLHHLHPRVEEGVGELTRILKPGGYFCCWEPNARSVLDFFRRIWYRMDRSFFQENEGAIDIPELATSLKEHFEIKRVVYGGGAAYLLVNCSLMFRMPIGLVNLYAPALIATEKALKRIQPPFLSLWVLCLMQKKNGG